MRNYKSNFFTKRHYMLLGKLVGNWYINGYINNIDAVLQDLIEIFISDNINFDENKFLEYVKDYIEKNS